MMNLTLVQILILKWVLYKKINLEFIKKSKIYINKNHQNNSLSLVSLIYLTKEVSSPDDYHMEVWTKYMERTQFW